LLPSLLASFSSSFASILVRSRNFGSIGPALRAQVSRNQGSCVAATKPDRMNRLVRAYEGVWHSLLTRVWMSGWFGAHSRVWLPRQVHVVRRKRRMPSLRHVPSPPPLFTFSRVCMNEKTSQ
jgi:hypothetical protein